MSKLKRKLDLRQDIAEMCAVDLTPPPEKAEALQWRDGDRFTNVAGHAYRWTYAISGWRRVD